MTLWYLEGYFSESPSLRKVPINDFPFYIGRSDDLGLTINQKDVSRKHAEIIQRDGELYIRDLGSTNGTFVNHHKIPSETHITGNDVVHFAHIESRLRMQDSHIVSDGSETMMMFNSLESRIPVGANELKDMITNTMIDVVYQSVMDTSENIVGFEILGRGKHPLLPKSPSELFRIAESIELEVELSELFRTVGLNRLPKVDSDVFILVNMHPREVDDPERLLTELANSRKANPKFRIILEIHEQAVTDLRSLQALSGELRNLNIGIAYDDFGAGQARLIELSGAPPEIVKFDIALIKDIDIAERNRQRMLGTLVAMVHDMGVKALAEGVSRQGEADFVKASGFDFIQGFLYGQALSDSELKHSMELS